MDRLHQDIHITNIGPITTRMKRIGKAFPNAIALTQEIVSTSVDVALHY